MVTRMLLRRNFYRDSVALMTLSQGLTALPGIDDAGAVMSTEMNQALLRQAGLLAEDSGTETGGPNDLLIVVRAASAEAAEAALKEAEHQLTSHQSSTTAAPTQQQPVTIAQAVQQQPLSNLALISVPGAYAAVEAREALLAGLHVLLF